MKRIIIAHGWDGSSTADWMPWATTELRKQGYVVICPDFPNTKHPRIEEWVPFLSKIVGTPDDQTILIGHSIGCQTIMRYLETIDTPIAGVVYVAGFFETLHLGTNESDAIIRPWLETPINIDKIRQNMKFSVAILSNNDPYVPYDEAKVAFANAFGSEIVTMHGNGHITSDDGFGPFPQLIEIIKNHA